MYLFQQLTIPHRSRGRRLYRGIIPIGETIIPEDIAVVPELLDEGGWSHFTHYDHLKY
jgi:hypothetical protein